jgi:hypothetical protein
MGMNAPIEFIDHAIDQARLRGATVAEVTEAIRNGEEVTAKKGRTGYRKNFPFGAIWKGRYYETKQVLVITVREDETILVITVYAFYF